MISKGHFAWHGDPAIDRNNKQGSSTERCVLKLIVFFPMVYFIHLT
jgi:hypothetical protein